MKKNLTILCILLLVFALIQPTFSFAENGVRTPPYIYATGTRVFDMSTQILNQIFVTRIVNYAVYQGNIPLLDYYYDSAADHYVAHYGGYIPRVYVHPNLQPQ